MSPRATYRIFRIDAFEWLEARRAKSVRAVVTDPPYGILEYTPEQLEKRRNGGAGIWRLPNCFDGCKRSPMPRFTVLGTAELVAPGADPDAIRWRYDGGLSIRLNKGELLVGEEEDGDAAMLADNR